jgi:hypothetical protein
MPLFALAIVPMYIPLTYSIVMIQFDFKAKEYSSRYLEEYIKEGG